jgi:hypothetical protein
MTRPIKPPETRPTTGWPIVSDTPQTALPREPGEGDSEYFLRVLPRPPEIGSDETVSRWLEAVVNTGGGPALAWAFSAENFPEHLRPWRMRVDHVYHQLMRQVELRAQRATEIASRRQVAAVEDERLRRRKEAGW